MASQDTGLAESQMSIALYTRLKMTLFLLPNSATIIDGLAKTAQPSLGRPVTH